MPPPKKQKDFSIDRLSTRLPLSALLSAALVAFTIEFDNEFEHRMPHRTTDHGFSNGSNADSTRNKRSAPWLGSLALWTSCMQFIGEDGVRVRDLEALARTRTNLNGLERWGYVVVAPDPHDTRQKPPRSAWIIRATPGGKMAQGVWRPLFGRIEERWEHRFGKEDIGRLRKSLCMLIRPMEIDLPDYLPIVGYGLFSRVPDVKPLSTRRDCSELPLSGLLSRVLLAFAVQFEHKSPLSLAISANALRVLSEEGVRVPNIPALTGISKELVRMSLGFLEKAGMATVGEGVRGRVIKAARLTTQGVHFQKVYHVLTQGIEGSWQERFGGDAINNLRANLEPLVGDATSNSPLFRGLEPYPDGWRAKIPRPTTLPYYPLVTHRGGYPDGS